MSVADDDAPNGVDECVYARLADLGTSAEAIAQQFKPRKRVYTEQQAQSELFDESDLVDVNAASDQAAIDDYLRRDEELQQSIAADRSLALENAPDRPPWYADEATKAIAAIRVDNVVVVAYVDSPLQQSAIVAQLANCCLSQNPASYSAIIMRHLNPRPDASVAPRRKRERTALHSYTGGAPVSATSLIFRPANSRRRARAISPPACMRRDAPSTPWRARRFRAPRCRYIRRSRCSGWRSRTSSRAPRFSLSM